MIKVLVWCENQQNKTDDAVKAVYPNFMHNTIADFLNTQEDITATTATLDDENCGITDAVLAETDVLIWWGHIAHHLVPDEIAKKIQNRVLDGMGLIPLHSAHYSKPFKLLMGTECGLRVPLFSKEKVWCTLPGHPIAKGVPNPIEIPEEEGYAEEFKIPQPDELVFIGGFENCFVFRSGCAYHRGKGKVYYFQPGHETLPIFFMPEIQQVIINAVRWAKM